jgi:hypothetical protein
LVVAHIIPNIVGEKMEKTPKKTTKKEVLYFPHI